MQKREKLHQGKRLSICAEINHVVIAQEKAQADAALGQFGRLWMKTNEDYCEAVIRRNNFCNVK